MTTSAALQFKDTGIDIVKSMRPGPPTHKGTSPKRMSRRFSVISIEVQVVLDHAVRDSVDEFFPFKVSADLF